MRRKRIDKKLRLIKMFLEFRTVQSLLDTRNLLLVSNIGSSEIAPVLCRWNLMKPIRPIVDNRFVDCVSHESVSLVVHHGTQRSVDRKIVKVERSTKLSKQRREGKYSVELGVQIRKIAALQKRIIRKVNSTHNIASAESDLFCFCEKFVDIPVKFDFTNVFDWNKFLRPEFRGIQDIKVKTICLSFCEELNSEFPSGIRTVVDGAV